ncbi:hypothetical protein [Streptomyces sp. NBC_01190]|uniref:hypothetical protein n=1 Tax=Streptomyces sp. NBC_01190 TaxID=2903767 RepID=UPI00386E9104|nr:hypothetical protein OG519_24740 [Streptomyces sp. NBC_01190]
MALAVRADHAVEARPFGRGGQAQDGVDVVAFSTSGPASVYQAKRYEKFTAADLRKAVAGYVGGSRPFGAHRLVVVTTADVRDTRVDLELMRLREQHQDMVIDLWGRQQLSDRLFDLPDLVRRFFGEDTMRTFCRPLPAPDAEPEIGGAAGAGVAEEYLAQLGAYLSKDLHELIPLPLLDEQGAERMSSAELAARLRPGQHIHLAGGSGTGKSHTLAHTVLGLITTGWVPILLRAAIYEGRLEGSLDECVTPFSPANAQDLVEAARVRQIPLALVVDALNECPAPLQDRLVQQISSWCRRTGATVVASSQEFVRVPAVLDGTRLRTADPDPSQRAALLSSHGADLEADGLVEDRCAAYDTAFELSLAAGLTRKLPPRSGRGALLEADVSEQLQQTSWPTAVRQVLHHWALLMDDRLTGWLPLAEAQRSAATSLASSGGVRGAVDEALRCRLVRVQNQRLEFRHEWYSHSLTAQALVWRCGNAPELARELIQPHRLGLAIWAVEQHSDPGEIRSLLRELSDGDVLTEALRGRLGPVADQITLSEARCSLETAIEVMAASGVVCSDDLTYEVEPRHSWSAYEQAVFAAAGATARDGRLLEPMARLLRQTDSAFWRGNGDAPVRSPTMVPSLIAATLDGTIVRTGRMQLPAETIASAARFARMQSGRGLHHAADAAEMGRWVASLNADDVGLPQLLCTLLRNTDSAETAALAPDLFARSWATGAGHLQFAALDLATSIRATADEDTVSQLTDLLNGLRTDNIWVSTMLVDALHIYDQVGSPYDVNDITEDISALLTDPNQTDGPSRAKRILESQFEDVIAPPFTEAIDALDQPARHALMVLAVRDGEASFFTDVFLKDLIRAEEPSALPAFRYWASHLDTRGGFRQNSVSCHLLGIEGCAVHLASPPPLLDGVEGNDADAWRCYGQILFWLHRPGIGMPEQQALCAPLWEQLTGPFVDAAADPLHQFHYADWFDRDFSTSALARIIDAFPTEARAVLHNSLTAPDRLTSIFPHPMPRECATTAIRLLARIGDLSSLPLLAAYRGHPDQGSAAADTIRRINNRVAPGT